MMAKPIKALQLHYSMIQFLIIIIIYKAVVYFGGKGCSCCVVIIVMMMMNFIHVSMYLADANWGHNIKIK